jgi:hypothetical protein
MNSDTELSPDERATLDALAQLPPIEPPGDLRERFRERAATERAVGPAPRRWITVGFAAALVLALGGGWWVDRARQERELDKVRTELATALSSLSAVTRLQAITVAGNSHTSDARIVAALTTSLLTDGSANVRVAAANALGRVADPNSLASAVTQSVGRETSPFVQAAVLSAIATLPQQDRLRLLRQMLSRADLDPQIRAEAEARIHLS